MGYRLQPAETCCTAQAIGLRIMHHARNAAASALMAGYRARPNPKPCVLSKAYILDVDVEHTECCS